MLGKLIELSVRNRFLVMIIVVLALAGGVLAARSTPVDAVPDLSDVQVIIFTEYPGQSPQIVEDQITYPLTTTMLSVPRTKVVRGYSFFGYSFVYIIFHDGTDMYWARSRVLEYLNYAASRLPAGVSPALGPDATGVGWAFEYFLQSDHHDLAQLRSIQDWQVRYALQQVPGVAEVASVGGFVKQYQVVVDPQKLQAFGVPLATVRNAIIHGNRDVGGRVIELGETEFMVRGLGYIKTLDDLRGLPLSVGANHVPIRVADVATVQIGPEMRRGVVDWNGDGEVVGGVVIIRYGANAKQVIADVKVAIAELESALPEGVEIVSAYDRSGLIDRAVETLGEKIVEECLIVAVICVLFLLHIRSALVAIFTLPAGVLLAILVMRVQGIPADIMSLGGIAIAIGAMVDAALVMIENMHKHVERAPPDADRWKLAIEASKEVGPSLFFSLLIIAFSFAPVFALEDQEGRLFKPLAFTKTYSMLGAALLSVTIVPVLMGYLVRGKIRPESANPISRVLVAAYRPVLRLLLRHPLVTGLVSLVLLGVTIMPVRDTGSEFMPPLYEGDLLYMPSMLPGISVTKAKQVLQQTDRTIARFPEVAGVFGKVGRFESATDPAPLNMIETIITLKPESEWREGMTPEKLVKELDSAIRFPGVTNAWTMPIKTRIDMLATGIKTPVGIKILGPDLYVISKLGKEIEAALRPLDGTASVYSERVAGGNFLDIEIHRDQAARYGISVDDVQAVITSAVGGMNVGQTVEGLERYPINVRYPRDLRESPEAIRNVLVHSPMGHYVPLGELASFRTVKGPPVVKSEGAVPTGWIYVDVSDPDIGGYVGRAKAALAESVEVPAGYRLVWSGQFEYMERAAQRLQLIVPVTLLVVFLLLYLNFRNLYQPLLLLLMLPMSLTGGAWLVWLLGYQYSVAVGVGFIALAGVASETAVIMVLYVDHAVRDAADGGALDAGAIRQAVLTGATERIRPVMMTVCAIVFGLLPIMWSAGAGASVMKRVAAPMIGGMATTTAFTLFVLPVVYGVVLRIKHRRDRTADA